jgi:hypothetical protein
MQSAKLAHISQQRVRLALLPKELQQFQQEVFFRLATYSNERVIEINAINAQGLIKLPVQLNGHWIKALINSGS